MAIPKFLKEIRNAAQMNELNNGEFISESISIEDGISIGDSAQLTPREFITDGNIIANGVVNAESGVSASILEAHSTEDVILDSETGEITAVSRSYLSPNELSFFNAECDLTIRPGMDSRLYLMTNDSNVCLQFDGPTLKVDSLQTLYPNDPSDVATKEYVDNNGGVFWAEYEVTTLEELQTAYAQGKAINVLGPGGIFTLASVIYTSELPTYFSFTNSLLNSSGQGGAIKIIQYDNGWSIKSQRLPIVSDNPSDISNNYFTNSNFMNGATDLTVGQARNITISTSAPTSSDGNIGDIWIVYTE